MFSLLLTLAVAFGSAGENVAFFCDCGCEGAEEVCPCGHTGSNTEMPSDASVPNCATHTNRSSHTAVYSAVIQTGKKANTASDTGKLFVSARDFPEYSAFQFPITPHPDLMRGPPKLNGFEKTNTRLAALSTLRI
ncbi:MAG: hypothetical protein LBB40_06155 [Holophagales bacterium]|nr:hypothetical protein [Holophagales bacterium]